MALKDKNEMDDDQTRCFVCSARDFRPSRRSLAYPSAASRRFVMECGHCGLLCDQPRTAAASGPAHLRRALQEDDFLPDPDAAYGADLFTLRIAASRLRRHVRPVGEAQLEGLVHPHSPLAANATLSTFETIARPPVTLAILCRKTEIAGASRLGQAAVAAFCDDVVLMVDDEPRSVESEGRVRIAHRPLGGDFAAQRNAAQDLALLPWVLQIDADETVGEDIVSSLGAIVAMAEIGELYSLGFARRNLVDGRPSDLFPDIQYRLNRRSVRFAGRVHERPDLDGDWSRSSIALSGTIDHHLTTDRVLQRSVRYEGMDPGRGRSFEAAALLEPYRP